jgi:uncharacterized phage protein (TIGR02218 family)
MLNLSSALQSIIADYKGRPTEIHDIYLGSQTEEDDSTLHFAAYYKTINFFTYLGQTAQAYTPLGIKRTAVRKSSRGEIDTIGYQLDNVNKAMGAFAASKDFRNKRIVTRLVFRDALDSVDNAKIIFDGLIQSIQFEQATMKATCAPIISSLSFKTGWPYQINCNCKFGDGFCQVNKNAAENRVDGTATSGGSKAELIDTANLTQADDYWNIGVIVFDSGDNINVSRKVVDFDQATSKITFDYPLDNDVSIGDQYHVFRGCDKRLATCKNVFNNDINYHGFHTIPLTK